MSNPRFEIDRDAWRTMSDEELAKQYNARNSQPGIDEIIRSYTEVSASMYELPHFSGIEYGEHPDEKIDLFPVSGKSDAPLLFYIHGGYWRMLAKEDSVFMAKTFMDKGIAVASVNYELSPSATLEKIVSQCRRALAHLYKHGSDFGIDVSRIVVSGSSAGGHLAAMLASSGWSEKLDMPGGIDSPIRGAILINGLYDLAPVQRTTPNNWLGLNEQRAVALSPINSLPAAHTRLLIATAEFDTDEFKRQSLMYAEACTEQGCHVDYVEIPQRNHFDINLGLCSAESELAASAIQMFENV